MGKNWKAEAMAGRERERQQKRQREKITKAITMKRAIQKRDSVDGATEESGNVSDGI